MPQADKHTTSEQIQAAPFILVVDDEPDIRSTLKEILEDEGYQVEVAQDGATAREAHRHRRPDLVLLDIWMPDIDGITLLKEWVSDSGLPMPVIMMSGHGTVETAVEATRLGAYDFIEKPLSLAKLLLTVEHALEVDKLQNENQSLRRHTISLQEPPGKSSVMTRLREQIKRIAAYDSWVMMQAEPGSGTNIAARFLHANSARRDRPFLEINLASITMDNSSQELFGSEENGHVNYGLLDQANNGTLLLQDIADMDADTQTKLFSTLDTGQFYRQGGEKPVDLFVRIIAATNQNIETLVDNGQFRKDLFFLLNVVPIHIPPLRDHREDVPEMLNIFIHLFNEHEDLPYRKFSMAAQNRLRNYDWPGNIRELMNLVQRLLITGTEEEISLEEVENTLGQSDFSGLVQYKEGDLSSLNINYDLPMRQAREQFEKDYLLHQLQKADGSVGKMAQAVGLERTHLYRKLRALGLDPKNISPKT